jgi:hypothetical protein
VLGVWLNLRRQHMLNISCDWGCIPGYARLTARYSSNTIETCSSRSFCSLSICAIFSLDFYLTKSNHTDGLVEGEAIALTASRRTSLSAHAFVLQASGVIGHNGQDAYQELDVKGRVMAHAAKTIPPSTVHFQSPRCVLQVSHSRSLPVPGARTATSCAKRAHGTPQQVRQLF